MYRTLFYTAFLLLLVNCLGAQDDCNTAYDLGILVCGDIESDTGDSGTTPDPEATSCMMGLDGTWYHFTTDPSVPEFTISGTDYELFEGSCGSLTYVDGCGNGLNIPADSNTDYYILVNGDFTLEFPLAPDNDDCATAIDASGGISGQSNSCASSDVSICGSDGDASVWYYIDIGTDLQSLTVEVLSSGIVDPVLALYESCGSQILEECSALFTADCIAAGTYFIQVASDYVNVGSFDLDLIETASSVTNETCDQAEDITPSGSCVAETVNGDSTGACPESSDFGSGCDIDINPAVWFEFSTNSGTSTVDFSNLSSNLELAVFEGSCGGAVFPCISSDASINVSGNETYYIAASLTTGGGSFDFDITLNETPPNDLCGDALSIEEGSFTTCCGNIEGLDQCGGSETGVWIEYFGVDGDGTMYTFNNIDMSGNIGIEIYEGDCGGLTLLNSVYCGSPGTYTFETENCEAGSHYIHVTSSNAGCGSFELIADPLVSCDLAEDCGDGPAVSPTTGGAQECVSSCNLFACDSGCGTSGVWFIVETDELATEMSIVVNDLGNSDIDPVVTVIQQDCSGNVLVACADVASGDIIETAVSGNQFYYVEVSSGSGGDPGEFELCVTTDESLVECSDGSLEPTRPEYPDADPEGPYCPGEVVNFCYEVTFTVDPIGQGNNCQWIQGIIPTVGGGWDLEALPIDAQGPGGSWFWLDEEQVAYQAPSSILGLINTPNGLGLEYGPGSLTDGDLLPGGWWSTSDGAGCANDGNPNTMWGLPASCGSTTDVEFCFDLQVGLLDDVSQCSDPDVTDLKVHIFTMADGQTGCWSNNSCSGDTPVTFNASIDCASLVFVITEDAEICSNDVLEIPLETDDGSDLDIIVELVEEGNTSGAGDHFFSGGEGVITDQIENEGDDVEIVIYEAYASDPSSICEGPRTPIEVIVYPEINVEGEDPYHICYGMPELVEPEVSGGDGGPYTYLWENGSTDPAIELPEDDQLLPGLYEIQLTVTDNAGCSKTEIIEYEIVDPLYPEIINPFPGICKDGIEDLPELFLEFESTGTGPYEFMWQASPGGLVFENGDNDQNLIINEEESSVRTYTIFGTVIDDYGCEYTTQTELVVDNGPDMEFEILECFGTSFALTGYEDNGQLVNFEIYYDAEGDFIFDGTNILQAELVATQFGNVINYLAEEYGTYILLGVSSNGCVDVLELALPPVPLPQFEVLPNDTLCAGESFTVSVLNASDYVNFNWSNNASGSSFMDSAVDTITYYLVAETADDCAVVDSLTIVVNPLPGINVTGSRSICPGAQTTLTVQGNASYSYLWNGPNGEMITTQFAVISTAGDWDLTVVSTEGCMNSTVITVTENNQLDPQIDGADLCTGETVILDGGAGFDSYEWYDGSGNLISSDQTAEVDSGGEYILNVILGAGASACSGSDTFTVQQFDPIEDALTATGADICNIDSGLLPVTIDLTSYENGVEGNWFDNNNLPVTDAVNVDFDGSIPGIYRYTFQSTNAMAPCPNESFPFNINVIDCSCPSVKIGSLPDFCNLIDSFDLRLIQITDEPGEWSIDPPMIDIVDTILIISQATTPGEYALSYTLTDPNLPPDCPQDSTVRFTVFESLDATLDQTVRICNEDTGNGPDTLDLDDLIIDADPGSWSTNEQGVLIDENNVVRFTGLELGNYRFLYYMEDSLSACPPVTRTVDVELINCSCPQFSINPLEDLCSTGGSYALNMFLDNPDNESGSWSVSGPDPSILVGGSVFASDREAGQYEFTFTLTNPQGGSCIASLSSTMNLYDPPEAIVEPEVFACNGTNITVYPTTLDFNEFVQGSGGIWTAPPSYNGGVLTDASSVDFEGLNPGVYSFTYTTNTAEVPCNERSYVMDVTVRNCNCPSVNFVPPSPLCNDGPDVDLDNYLPADAPEGIWSFISGNPAVMINDSSAFSLSGLEGFYLFQYTLESVPQGCPDFGQISIEVVAPPVVTHVPEAEVCNESSVNAPLCIDLNEFISGVDGAWTLDPTYDGDGSNVSNVCFENEEVGEVFFFIFNTETGSVTCDERQYTTVVNVLDCSCPNLNLLQAGPLCSGDQSFDLASLETMNTAEGTWSFQSGPSVVGITGSTIDMSGAESGSYTFRFTPDESGSSDCDAFNEVSIDIQSLPEAGVSQNSGDCISYDDQIILEDYIVGEEPGGDWYVNGQLFVEGAAGSTMLMASDYDPGLLTLSYSFSNIDPCPEISESFELVLMPLLQTQTADPPCAGTENGSIIIASIQDIDGLLFSIDGGMTWSESPEFDDLPPGIFDIIVEDEFGCIQTIENIQILNPEDFIVDAGEDREIDENIGSTNLQLASNLDLSDIVLIEWTEDGTIICSGGPEQCWSIDVSPDEIAEYCATVTDINGCVTTDCIIVRERLVKDVYIPNIFFPGSNTGDGIFYIQSDQYVESIDEFRIYDRWGNLIFEAQTAHEPNNSSFGWDGTMNDRFVEQGVYVYVISIRYTDGEEEYFTGDVTVIRD